MQMFPLESICLKAKPAVWKKKNNKKQKQQKKNINFSSAELTQGVVKVKLTIIYVNIICCNFMLE